MAKAEKLGKKILLPVDAVTIKDFPNPIDAPVETVDSMILTRCLQTVRAVISDLRHVSFSLTLLSISKDSCMERTYGCI